jgi:hypothetical protein
LENGWKWPSSCAGNCDVMGLKLEEAYKNWMKF